MASTPYQLPTVVVANGAGVTGWTNPSNILLVDGNFAVASGSTNILSVGTFNLNIPADSTLTNFTIKVKGYRGSFNTTLQIYAVDNSTGVDIAYPAAPFQGFSGTNTLYSLPSTLFGTTWTSDQANNIQIKLIADGELHLDSIEINADYVANVTPIPIPPSTGLVVTDEFVEAIQFNLAQSMTAGDLFCFLQTMNLPDGTPVQYADFHGEACLVIDQGIQGLEEQVVITNIEQDYQGTGLVRVSFGSITNRGLKFIYPYDHDISLCRAHSGTASIVISNSARFYSRFLRMNQINALVSAPIYVQDEGATLVDPTHTIDFQGSGVQVVNDGVDSFKKIVTISGNGVNPPNVVNTSSATSGASQVPTLTWNHESSGINRLIVVQVTTEAAAAVTGVTFNGFALALAVSNSNGTLKTEQWYRVAPSLGTHPIIVSVTPNAYLTCGAETFVSVDQATPIGTTQSASGSSLTPSVTLITTADNSLVVDSLVTGTLPIVYTSGVGQTENWHITANPNVRQGASSVEPAGTFPDNVQMSWAITQSIPWATNAVEINGIPGSGGGGGGHIIQDNGVPLPQEPALNFVDFFTVTDNAGVSTDVDINVTELANDATFITALTSNVNFQNAVNLFVGGSGTIQIDQTPLGTGSTFGTLAGAVNGINTTFTVSLGLYTPGKLQVYKNGLMLIQGSGDEWVETTPGSGIFDFTVAPVGGDTVAVVYSTVAAAPQAGIQFENEGVNLGAAGTVDEVDFTGSGVTASRVGNKVTVNVPSSGGSLGVGASYLPVGAFWATSGGNPDAGNDMGRNIFKNAATNRIYVVVGEATAAGTGEDGHTLRFFKNDYGNYYQEKELVISYTMLSDVNVNYTIQQVVWCTDNTNIFALVKYTKNTAGIKNRIDVVQFDLDGLNPVPTNLYTTNTAANSDHVHWEGGNIDSAAAVCVGGLLYITWATYSGAYVNFIREYNIGAWTLNNTYTRTGSNGGDEGRSLTYDAATSTFYLSGLTGGSNIFNIIQKYTISGANFVGGVTIGYPEFGYGNTAEDTSNVDVGYTPVFIEFGTPSYTIYVIQEMQNQYGYPTSNTRSAYWLTTYTFPKV